MISDGVRSVLSTMRRNNRRTIIQTAQLEVGDKDIRCMAYDISLGGIRVKADKSLKKGTNVHIYIKDRLRETAKVIWTADGFMGLSFMDSPENVRLNMGPLATGLS